MLKLAALDEDDLQIVSAHVQDAVVRMGDITWDRPGGRVLLEMNRFVWEKPTRKLFKTSYERRRSVLHIDSVTAVRTNGLAREQADEVLVLLSIQFQPSTAPGGVVELIFADNKAMRLDVDFIETRLTDLGSAWEAGSKPVHLG